MSQPTLIKVYANLSPADERLVRALREVVALAMPAENLVLDLEGELLRLTFEGVYFPEDDVIDVIKRAGAPDAVGKMDALDLENWLLRRYVFSEGRVLTRSAPLNNVLDYSGH